MEDQNKMEIISQLMEELKDLMGPSEDDFNSRLGREKPMEIEVEADGMMVRATVGAETIREKCVNARFAIPFQPF